MGSDCRMSDSCILVRSDDIILWMTADSGMDFPARYSAVLARSAGSAANWHCARTADTR